MSGRQTDRIEQMTPESRRFPANMSFAGKEAYCFSADILPTGAEPPRNLGKNQLAELLDKLSDRDFEILISLKYAKYLLTGQIKCIMAEFILRPSSASYVNDIQKELV